MWFELRCCDPRVQLGCSERFPSSCFQLQSLQDPGGFHRFSLFYFGGAERVQAVGVPQGEAPARRRGLEHIAGACEEVPSFKWAQIKF